MLGILTRIVKINSNLQGCKGGDFGKNLWEWTRQPVPHERASFKKQTHRYLLELD